MFRSSLFLLAFCVTARCGHSSDLPAGKPGRGSPDLGDMKWKPKFTIGKETTYVTGPLRKDGTIDYAAALNERLRKGVTLENNAYVLFWQAIGPRPEQTRMPSEFFKWLGMESPPERGDYFADLYGYLQKHNHGAQDKPAKEIDDLIARVSERPWEARQYPQVAAYIKANEKPLALVVEGTKRSHYFSPLLAKEDTGLINAPFPGVHKCREFATALAARAMLHLGEGHYDKAWQDQLACHRLGRLVSRGGTLIEALVGIAIDSIAGQADLVYLDRAKLTAKQVLDCLAELQRLPAMTPMADHIDLGERLMVLDATLVVARGGARLLEGLSGDKLPPGARDPKIERAWRQIDWSPALRAFNHWFDRMVAAMRLENYQEREKQLDRVQRDLRALQAQLKKSGAFRKAILDTDQSPAARGKALGEIFISLLLPAVRRVAGAGDRMQQIQCNLGVAFALAAYKADHGHYPTKLEALASKYLSQVPRDLFTGKSLIYRPSANGYLLYSVGVNGQDEQGRSYDDSPAGDDLVVRMPLPEVRRK